jgi:Undecaprenyl-phosphate galactose phosphotransferase WbaP
MSAKSAVLPSASAHISLSLSSSTPQWVTTFCILASDVLTLSLLFGIAVIGRHMVTPTYALSSYFDLTPSILMLIGAFCLQGLYPGALLHPAEEIRRTFNAITLVFLLVASVSFLWRTADSYSRAVFLITWISGAPIVLFTRQITRLTFANEPWWGVSAVVLGSGPAAQRVMRGLRTGKRGIRVVGVLSEQSVGEWPKDLPPVLGDLSHTPVLARSRAARYAIVAIPGYSNLELRMLIQDFCAGFSHVLLIPDLPGLCSLDIAAREVGGEVGFELPQRLFHRGAAFIKRSLDLLISGSAILLLSPIFLLAALAVRFSSKGPILFGHLRNGLLGESFRALKFRTMYPDGDRILAAHLEANPEDKQEWMRNQKLKNDPRVTWIGRWLRRFSIDELPQLFNVLIGDMSLIGPRPIVQSEIPKYGRGYSLYTRVRPGLSGLWQVSGRNNTTYEERVAFDEYYVRNWSIWMDAYILVRTVKVVFTAEGAY